MVDDATGDIGTMAGGWTLSVTTAVSAPTTTTVTTSGTPSTTGDPVTFAATVRSSGTAVAVGSVQFADGATPLGSPVAVNGAGVATLTTATLGEGTHEIRASYGGATGYLSSNGSVSQRVDNATVVDGNTFCNTGAMSVPTRGAASPYPSNIKVSGLSGTVSTVTAALKGLSHQVPVDLDIMLAGPQPATNVILLSDSGGVSPVSNLTVSFADDAAGPVPNPLVSGTFRPTNDDSSGVPDSFPAPAPAPSGVATLSTFDGASPNGTWSLWVVDDASADSGSISGGWCLTITTAAPTTTTLTSSPNPSTFGQPVTLSATVNSASSPVHTGSVQFTDGATPLGAAVPVDAAGQATLRTSELSVGTHSITAAYSGAGLGDSSADVTQVVDKAATSTLLTSAPNPSDAGAAVTFTATVTSDGNPVTTGQVQFSDDSIAIGAPVAVAPDGTATLTTSTLAVGTHPIRARYTGSASLATSSADLDQTVGQRATSTTLVSDANPSASGQRVTFTATVTEGTTPVTSGSVQFRDGGTDLGSPVPVSADGTAQISTADLTVGVHAVVATYSGTTDLAGSSDRVDQTVDPIADAGGPYTVAEGGDLTLDAGARRPGRPTRGTSTATASSPTPPVDRPP